MFWTSLGVDLCIEKLDTSYNKFTCILHSLNRQLLLRYTHGREVICFFFTLFFFHTDETFRENVMQF